MLSALLLSTLFLKAERPPQLPDKPGCEHYRGTASGNDPSVQLDVVLCPSGAALTGEVQWSSLESGWNLRRVEGSREGDRVTLRDIEVTRSRPERGWRFCEIDEYVLTSNGARLSGTYSSRACNDSATVSLERVAAPDGAGSVPPPRDGPTPTPVEGAPEHDARPAPSSDQPVADAGGGCGCTNVDADAGWPALVLLLARRRRD